MYDGPQTPFQPDHYRERSFGALWRFLNDPKTPSELRPPPLPSPNQTPRFHNSYSFRTRAQTIPISEPRGTAAFRLSQRRPFCFPHVTLYSTVTSLSRAFYFWFRVDYVVIFRSVVKLAALLLLCLKKCMYLSFSRAAGILVSNDSFVSILLVLHETSGTLIFFFFLMYYRWKKIMKRWTVRSVV